MEATVNYYFPPTPSEYPGWTGNFYTVLFDNKTLLGISDDDLNRVKRFRNGLAYYGDCINDYDPFVSKCVSNRNIMIYGDAANPELALTEYTLVPTGPVVPTEQVPPNEHAWMVVFVGRLRKNPNMNATLSKSLGIDARPVSKYENDVQLVLKGKVVNGQAELNCPLKNFKGYEVWRRDAPGGDFSKVGVSIARYYTDTSELPDGVNSAQRTYIVRMITTDNVPVGLPSNEVTLVVFRAAVPS